ncbi:hypothetical protein HPULCUR_007586 [Helicostylum pulchrum]|uniref:Uncharacterized protein n=1 Tax=Helicostylum pulchrum TaxID=562976 RepID=A0ABP9Y556_9FUNG
MSDMKKALFAKSFLIDYWNNHPRKKLQGFGLSGYLIGGGGFVAAGGVVAVLTDEFDVGGDGVRVVAVTGGVVSEGTGGGVVASGGVADWVSCS